MRGRSSKGATSSDRENRAITFLCSKVNIAYWNNTQVQETGKGFRRFCRRSQFLLLNNLSLWRAMQVLPVTFMKQSESNKKHLGNMSLDLVFSHELFHF